jgi:hypothetical protein
MESSLSHGQDIVVAEMNTSSATTLIEQGLSRVQQGYY